MTHPSVLPIHLMPNSGADITLGEKHSQRARRKYIFAATGDAVINVDIYDDDDVMVYYISPKEAAMEFITDELNLLDFVVLQVSALGELFLADHGIKIDKE